MKFLKQLLLIIVFFFGELSTFAQNQPIEFKRLTIENGLAQDRITSIFQDSFGFMWFGTNGNGISKFDSYEFKEYKHNTNNKNSLSDNYINSFYEDKKHRLWVATSIGLNYYDRENDRFIRFQTLQQEYITGFYENETGKLFVITSTSINEIN